jgi:septal ring factor EnvC (AmiA/AmiB activator)
LPRFFGWILWYLRWIGSGSGSVIERAFVFWSARNIMTEKKSVASASPAPKGFTAKPQPESAPTDQAAIATLQAELAAKDEQIAHLQLKLDRAEESAKHLASLNQTLMTENEHLKADNVAQAQAAPIVPVAKEKTFEEKSAQLTASQGPRDGARLMHPVFPNGKLPSGMGDQDLGWFD